MSIYKDFYEENYEKVQKIKEIEKENEQLKKQNAILLGQLVINDGEDVTVQISQSQFDEYNELKEENARIKQLYNCYACDTCNGKEDYRNMKRHCENAIKTVQKHRQALNEIGMVIEELEQQYDDISNFTEIKEIKEILSEVE